MRKLVAIFFLFIFSLPTGGATICMHYCMDRLVGWSLYHGNNKKCENCGMDKSKAKGCCKDICKQIKIKKECPQPAESFTVPDFNSSLILVPYSVYSFTPVSPVSEIYATSHAPPLLQKVRLHILYCTYLI
jgi:hypothetical protein